MRFCFSTNGFPPDDRLRAWGDYISDRLYGYTPGGVADANEFTATMDGFTAGRFTLVNIRANHATARRTAAHVAKDLDGKFVICRFNQSARWSAALRSAPVDIQFAPGDFVITSSEWEFDSVWVTTANWDVLLIPKSALSPRLTGGRLSRPVRLEAKSPLGALLDASFDAAKAQVPLLSSELGEAVLLALCELVALACAATDDPSSARFNTARTEQLEAAKRYIDQHLAEPGLTPASTAAALGISLRQLHVLFKPTGTSFARYVLRQRVLKCRDTIASATGTGRSVIDIALGWGFNSMATFYRAHASEFGGIPTSARPVLGEA